MSDVSIVVGLSGVGKSTVLEEEIQLTDTAYEIINYGNRMVDIAREEAVAEGRDELRNVDSEMQKQI